MKSLGRYWLAFTLVAAAFLLSLTLYRSLPQTIAIHWNAQGPDGWAPKHEGAFITPGFSGILVGFLILIAPWALDDEENSGARLKAFYYPTIVAAVAGFAFYLNASMLLTAVGIHLNITSDAIIGAGLLFVIVGHALSNVHQYRAEGFPDPYTPPDTGRSARTPQVAGRLLMLTGTMVVLVELFDSILLHRLA